MVCVVTPAIPILLEPGVGMRCLSRSGSSTAWLPDGCQTPTVWWLPDTHRFARGILIAANHLECGCLEPSGTPSECGCLEPLRSAGVWNHWREHLERGVKPLENRDFVATSRRTPNSFGVHDPDRLSENPGKTAEIALLCPSKIFT
jgi:hypothetical protein